MQTVIPFMLHENTVVGASVPKPQFRSFQENTVTNFVQTIIPFVFQFDPCPKHNSVRVPREYGDQSIQSKPQFLFVFQENTVTAAYIPKENTVTSASMTQP